MRSFSVNVVRSRQLRRVQTSAEYELWQQLRGRQLEGLKFRRQHTIGPFIADFVCLAKKLVIKVDGGQHNKRLNKIYDSGRTNYLEHEGYRVLRFSNSEALTNMDEVLS